MKKCKYIFMLYILSHFKCFANTIVTDVNAYVYGTNVHITYNLLKDANISIYSSLDNFQNKLKQVKGDVGTQIKAGKNREIIWNPLSALQKDSVNEKISFEVKAEQIRYTAEHANKQLEPGLFDEDGKPYFLLTPIIAINFAEPQLSWGIDCGLIWEGDVIEGGFIFKFRTSFGYCSETYYKTIKPSLPDNCKIKKNYYNGTIGGILGCEYIYVGLSMGYGYKSIDLVDKSSGRKVTSSAEILKGFAGDLGVYITLSHNVYLSISVGTIKFKYAECVMGIGYKF